MMRVLVVQWRRIGDLLMVTPLLRALKRALPEATVSVLVQPDCACALAGNPHVDACLDASTANLSLVRRFRRERLDVVIDAMGKGRSALLSAASGAPTRIGLARSPWRACYTHRLPPRKGEYSASEKLRLLAPLGIVDDDVRIDMPGTSADRDRAEAWWRTVSLAGHPAPIAVAPVSRRPAKRWPSDRFAAVCDHLAARTGRRLLLLFGPGERAQAEAVRARAVRRDAFVCADEVLPFAALPAVVSRCAGYVGNDNAIRHLAVAANLPTLAVFGPPAPVNWTPPVTPWHLAAGGRRDIRTVTLEEVWPLATAFEQWLPKDR